MALNDQQKMAIAMFRYGLIAPVLQKTVSDPAAYIEDLVNQVHEVPHYGSRQYSKKTFHRWISDYRRGNLEGLMPQTRQDKNVSRAISATMAEEIINYRLSHPDWTVKLIYDQMMKEELFAPEAFSYHTLFRFLRQHQLLKVAGQGVNPRDKERKKFSFDEVNHLWQGDMMVGPYVNDGDKRKRAYLFAFIDDASRIIPFAYFSVQQNMSVMKDIYLKAVIRRGIPKLLYLDNAKIYRSSVFHEGCARMGTTVVHAAPYDAPSKGKIERFFSTVRKRFLPLISTEMLSLNDLNRAFCQWLEEDYHRKVHAGIGITPLEKYMSQVHLLKMVNDPASVRYLFLRREQRRVNNDATIYLKNVVFEVPGSLIGEKIDVRFDPENLEEAWLYPQDQIPIHITPVKQADNARIKRTRANHPVLENENSSISFSVVLARKGD